MKARWEAAARTQKLALQAGVDAMRSKQGSVQWMLSHKREKVAEQVNEVGQLPTGRSLQRKGAKAARCA